MGLSLRELVFANTAKWAHKIFGKVLEIHAGLQAIFSVTNFGIIFPSANVAYVLHISFIFKCL